MKILGLYNESRGRDSCGYYFNGNIQKGVYKESDFSDFIAANRIVAGPLKGKTFMGHTRKGTSGGFTLENAHPHVVNDNYVQTHNGVIKEPWALCNKFEVDHSKIHVDSIGLAHLIDKVGPKPILEAYKGHAALAFTWMNNPEALYLYHGASREKADGELISERPLFIMHQPEGLYYSSMIEALEAINSSDTEEPFPLKHNTIWEIINGELTGKKVYIERANNNIIQVTKVGGGKTTTVYPYQPPANSASAFKPGHLFNGNNSNNKLLTKKLSSSSVGRGREDEDESNENDMVKSEPLPTLMEKDLDKVIYNKGRYYRVTRGTAGTIGTAMMDGAYVIDRDGKIVNEDLDEKKYLGPKEERYYFIHGAMIKTKFDYEDLRAKNITGATEDGFRLLSGKSRFPIIQFRNAYGVGKNLWFHQGGRVVKGTYDPKFTSKKYKIRYGRTKEIIGG